MSTDSDSAPPPFHELVDAYYIPLYRFAHSLTGNESDAADLTQDVFLIWARKGGDLREASKVKSWLFTTLYREFLRQRKRGRRMTSQEPEVLDALTPAIPASQVRDLDARHAVEAIQEIDAIFREPLTLFYVEDLSYREIAEVLDLPIGTVMSRLSRGKDQLKNALRQKSRN